MFIRMTYVGFRAGQRLKNGKQVEREREREREREGEGEISQIQYGSGTDWVQSPLPSSSLCVLRQCEN